jgi:hypothetical protein
VHVRFCMWYTTHTCYAADWSLRNDDTGVIKSMVQKAGLKTVEDTVTHLLKLFDSATRETESFMNFDGSTHPW